MAIEKPAPNKLAFFAAFLEFGDVDASRFDLFRRISGGCAAALGAVTWRLWTPQSVFPQVPLVRVVGTVPSWLEWILLSAVASALFTLIMAKNHRYAHRASAVLVVALALLFLIDQHRLQPWAYEFAIIGFVMAACRPRLACWWLRVMTISIYVFSALGKFDFEFTHTTGQQFLNTLLSLVGWESIAWVEAMRYSIVTLFPVTELLIAMCLCCYPLRRVGVALSIVFHVTLVVLLGPLGLRHQPAVLIWNLFFMAKVTLLFGLAKRSEAVARAIPTRRERWTGLAVALLALWPLLEPCGCIDHWLAWGLYSPRNSRVALILSASTDVPEELVEYLKPSRNGYQEFDIDAWSIDALSVPIYPQDRFQIGVALALINQLGSDPSIRVVRQGMAARRTGKRRTEVFSRLDRVHMAAETFFFNAHPRQNLAAR